MTEAASNPINHLDPFAAGADALHLDSLTPAVEAPVIDLRDAATTRVRVERDDNPFSTLSKQERMRLIVRVLCEIVAYGELDDTDPVTAPTDQSFLTPDRPAING